MLSYASRNTRCYLVGGFEFLSVCEYISLGLVFFTENWRLEITGEVLNPKERHPDFKKIICPPIELKGAIFSFWNLPMKHLLASAEYFLLIPFDFKVAPSNPSRERNGWIVLNSTWGNVGILPAWGFALPQSLPWASHWENLEPERLKTSFGKEGRVALGWDHLSLSFFHNPDWELSYNAKTTAQAFFRHSFIQPANICWAPTLRSEAVWSVVKGEGFDLKTGTLALAVCLWASDMPLWTSVPLSL